MSNHSAAARTERILDALGEPSRRRILELLVDGPTAVGTIAERLDTGRPGVSKHLRVLSDAGLVQSHSVGTRNLYALAPGGLAPLQQWLADTWDAALSAYAERVTATKESQHTHHDAAGRRRTAS